MQVNDVQLYGKSRREVVSFLKEVPPPFTLVCCRHPSSDLGPDPESESESEPKQALEPSQPSVEEVRGRQGNKGGQSVDGRVSSWSCALLQMELKLSSMLCRDELAERQQEPTQVPGQVHVHTSHHRS